MGPVADQFLPSFRDATIHPSWQLCGSQAVVDRALILRALFPDLALTRIKAQLQREVDAFLEGNGYVPATDRLLTDTEAPLTLPGQTHPTVVRVIRLEVWATPRG